MTPGAARLVRDPLGRVVGWIRRSALGLRHAGAINCDAVAGFHSEVDAETWVQSTFTAAALVQEEAHGCL